jgi:cytochrome b pre-mRNA-processing protein 3
MFGWLTTKTGTKNTAATLYGEIVSAARNPMFYRDLGVPDTVEGRFELIALHLTLMVHRLSQDNGQNSGQDGRRGNELARALNEACITDLDDNMREIGISDLAVPRKIKKAAAALFDRHRDIVAALAAQDTAALDAVLKRDIGELPGASQFDAHALARHLIMLHATLSAATTEQIIDGTVSIATPVTP